MKVIFNRYQLISTIFDNMQIFDTEEREALRPRFAKLEDSTLLKCFPMFYCIRKGFYTTI